MRRKGMTMNKKFCYFTTAMLLLGMILGITHGAADTPDIPTSPMGPTIGSEGEVLEFTAIAYDPDEDRIQYFFDFGDGTDSYWIPENGIESGEQISTTHTFELSGTFEVKIKVRDLPDLQESEYSTPLFVNISPLSIISIQGGFGVTVEIQNKEDFSKDVNWSVTLIGGTIPGFHINKEYKGTTLSIKPEETVTATMSPVFALGKFTISIEAYCAGAPVISKEVEGKILLFYVLI